MPKTNQINDLRKLSVEDLIKTGEEKRAELFALKFQAVLGSLEQTHRIKLIKKEIARIELVLGELKHQGQDTNKTIKADYNKAVEAADLDGKKVREQQLKKIEELQTKMQQDQEDGAADSLTTAVEEEAKGDADDGKK
ncbi:50S ribosomal protein L29 [Mesoplasma sp. JKS002658]|uniref:50S ribosomal protein L29 n=1 Tax=Mesoplasma whartonense TaxID=2878854 RepID=UPI002022A395|nr:MULTISPECIES: 50S ribosomal protein L29 [unclassified Mesoplasma]MCL8211382.1 50S ribosomal protein L29 [Mesoplasma sp. JKS002664]MCL8212235.1 50S ribosomal protein L29 [Mesoplasma sp. JKS002662]MCL8214236.1 50S ribosomal protein L29 [Mesoplasma sp. JKS002658]MCL8214720.1 50S ribosomal protein L29 [Mesoplasma sp. JKS002663]MCL8215556.1 50S ribosomal protein L29 [Mesoplasma sp. JKS002659]